MHAGSLRIAFSFSFRIKVSHLSGTHFQRVTKGFKKKKQKTTKTN